MDLSLKAKGLLSLMLSLPENWDYTTKGLAKICRDGVDSICSTVKELEEHGYIIRQRVRNNAGQLTTVEYTILEQPQQSSPKREKHMLVASDNTKTKSSMRTLPLVPAFKEKLLAVRAEQEHNRKLCGRAYNKEYQGYICINEIGEIINPTYITAEFPQLLERNGLRKIRYHDLRRTAPAFLLHRA